MARWGREVGMFREAVSRLLPFSVMLACGTATHGRAPASASTDPNQHQETTAGEDSEQRDADQQSPTGLSHERAAPAREADANVRRQGLATYYASSLAGHRTANGERYDPNALTAAHRSLRFGTWVRVTRADRRAQVTVRINDRGPFGDDRRIIDLSKAAAARLGMLREGVVEVRLEILKSPH